MHKRQLHHLWTQLRPINVWIFLTLFAISSVVAVLALRHNNLTAVKLRDTVLQADKDNGDTETALKNLRQYIYSHMHTELASGANAIRPPIQLKYRYERLVAAEQARVSATNAQVYTAAQAYCEQQFPHGLSGGGRVPCIQDYVTKHGAKEQPIPESLYKFDFVSPFWSPDLAGWSLVFAGLFLLLFIVRYSVERLIRTKLRQHE